MKYAWIEKNKLRWPVCVQCRVLVSSFALLFQAILGQTIREAPFSQVFRFPGLSGAGYHQRSLGRLG